MTFRRLQFRKKVMWRYCSCKWNL